MTISRPIPSLILIGILAACSHTLLPAQGLGGLLGGKSNAPAAAPMEDALNRTTPRSAVRSFLDACHNERYIHAALYLDLQNMAPKKRSSDGPDLAKNLADLLDHDSHFDVNSLNDTLDGTPGDGLKANRELLVALPRDVGHVNLYLEREQKPGGATYWLVSQDTVARIPELANFDQETAFEKKLPAVLITTKLLGTSIWVWFALALAAIILFLLSRLFSKIVLLLVKPFAKRYASPHTHRLETLADPLRLLLAISVFRAVIEFLDPSAVLRDYLLKLLTLLFAFGCASLIMRIIDAIFDRIQSRLNSRERALTYSVLPLAVRVIKVLVFCIFVLFTLAGWGYNTNTILAGVGVGGLAVALAAQKTIENFFGGVSVITDQPVLVGDFCQFGGQVGTIEDIGLRSTRIRTLDRTIVTIPNSQFSTMTLENYSRRDRMWFHPTLHLSRETTADQVEAFMHKMIELLQSDPIISIGGLPLRFTKIGDQSLQIEVFAYILSADFDKYLEWQSILLLKILRIGEELGIAFAVPIVESLTRATPEQATSATEVSS